MELKDKVWYMGTAQELHDSGYTHIESTFLMHTYGTVIQFDGDRTQLSFEEWCNKMEGFDIVMVWVPTSKLELADPERYMRF